MRLDFSISSIETFLYALLKPAVSSNVFPSTLPDVIQDEWTEMVLFDCSLPMIDFEAYASGTFYIYLYARPLSDGTKNVAKMKSLEEKLINSIENSTDDKYRISVYSTNAGYDEDALMHVNQYELILNVY